MDDVFARVDKAADVIGVAIAKHYHDGLDVYAVLGGLSTIAADIISKAPADTREELMKAWDESPAWVRQSLQKKSGKN